MDSGPARDGRPSVSGSARAGRRRQGAFDGLGNSLDSRLEWLTQLGPDPIRLTPGNVMVSMSVRWLGGLIVRGTFENVRGMIHVPNDAASAAVTVEIAADSVRTGISLRDRHLRGALFLDAAHHPVITFRGGDIMRWPTHIAVPGSLTIRGVTRTEELRCALEHADSQRHLVGDVTLSRRAYGVGVPRGIRRLDPLFMVIGDEVRISVRVTL
ncbi:MAG TPA: YceI family protein [Gemmatimonadaceae bacterium]|nr:YceI family protein [Gemmatimonadaceae bacterium]